MANAKMWSSRCGIIIPAAGSGSRMGTARPKQFLELAGVPVLARTLQAVLAHPKIEAAVAVLPPDQLQSGAELLRPFLAPAQQEKLLFAAGGASRQQSVRKGLAALPADIDRVLVHDGARPLVTAAIIDRCIAGLDTHGAVIAAVPVNDTLKEASADGAVLRTVDRERLWQAQTPQAALRRLLEQACQQAEADGFVGTDEASLLERAGIPVSVVMGSERNLKLTRLEDMTLAAALIGQEEGIMRIGHGFDAHRLVEGRRLVLGGEVIPYHLGLDGHSDADVLVHALMDALLGALGEGDLGRHFPDTDAQYRGADSCLLLARVMDLVRAKGLRLLNADITVICQRPKLAPHRAAMQARLRSLCGTEAVNIKATTTEGMGYAGRGEGISSHAVVLLAGSSPSPLLHSSQP